MSAMRCVPVAGNASADGDLDAFGTAGSPILLPEGADPVTVRFALSRALFAVVDRTTLRLWDLPQALPETVDSVEVVLEQAGTGIEPAVGFRRVEGL